MLGLAPLPSLITLAVWCSITFGTGYVSLGSIVSAVVLPTAVIVEGLARGHVSLPISGIAVILGILVIVRHRSNISRLLKGEENRFGRKERHEDSCSGSG